MNSVKNFDGPKPRGRPKKSPTLRVRVALPEADKIRLDLFLFDTEVERVPPGAHSTFFLSRVREFFSWETLPLEPYGFPPGFFIRGPREMVNQLKERLQ